MRWQGQNFDQQESPGSGHLLPCTDRYLTKAPGQLQSSVRRYLHLAHTALPAQQASCRTALHHSRSPGSADRQHLHKQKAYTRQADPYGQHLHLPGIL